MAASSSCSKTTDLNSWPKNSVSSRAGCVNPAISQFNYVPNIQTFALDCQYCLKSFHIQMSRNCEMKKEEQEVVEAKTEVQPKTVITNRIRIYSQCSWLLERSSLLHPCRSTPPFLGRPPRESPPISPCWWSAVSSGDAVSPSALVVSPPVVLVPEHLAK